MLRGAPWWRGPFFPLLLFRLALGLATLFGGPRTFAFPRFEPSLLVLCDGSGRGGLRSRFLVGGGRFWCCCLAALLPALVLRLEMTPAHGSAYKKRGPSTKTWPTQSVPSSLLRCCSHGRNIIPIDIASATLSNQQLLNVCKRTSRLSIVSASTQAAWPAMHFSSRCVCRPRAHWRPSKRRRRRNHATTS